jgi:type I restriction enzyme S subunit
MASGFGLLVNGVAIGSSEALYQACRFPHLPDVQQAIVRERSPMTAKMRSVALRDQSRVDWARVRVRLMRWCLRVKLAQHWERFSALLLSTGVRPIVEVSRRDAFWGAKPEAAGLLVGANILGRLLMELREERRHANEDWLRTITPPDVPNLLLLGGPVGPVAGRQT